MKNVRKSLATCERLYSVRYKFRNIF